MTFSLSWVFSTAWQFHSFLLCFYFSSHPHLSFSQCLCHSQIILPCGLEREREREGSEGEGEEQREGEGKHLPIFVPSPF